jgi:hypothetical protein
MAAITYASFPDPRFADEPSSLTIHPHKQSESFMNASTPIDLNVVEISDVAVEDDDFIAGLNPLDCAGYHLAMSTPTKERTRRATMPESMKQRPQGVISQLVATLSPVLQISFPILFPTNEFPLI